MFGGAELDDDLRRILRARRATQREREWMAAALRRAAQHLDDNATGQDRELGHGRKGGLPRGDVIHKQGRIDGLRIAATELRRWAQACEGP